MISAINSVLLPFIVSALVSLYGAVSFATKVSFGEQLPLKNEMLQQIGEAKHESLDAENLNILVWNIYKAKCELKNDEACKTKTWSEDFQNLAQDKDVIMAQEATMAPLMIDTFERMNNYLWNFGISFKQKNGLETGVITATSVNAKTSPKPLRSPVKEGGFTTPKMMMLNYHNIHGSQHELLTINIHAINVHTLNGFKRHINQAKPYILKHKGPVVFAGDFNTHMTSRLSFLTKLLVSELGFEKVNFKHEKDLTVNIKGNPVGVLDHAYVRGLEVVESKVFGKNCKGCNVTSSDHTPFFVKLKLKTQLK